MSQSPNRVPPQVLIPFDVHESISVGEAAKLVGRTTVTVRGWAARFHIGRRVGGLWLLSRVALDMYLESDRDALNAYLKGDRESSEVLAYFDRVGVVPKKISKEIIEREKVERIAIAPTAV